MEVFIYYEIISKFTQVGCRWTDSPGYCLLAPSPYMQSAHFGTGHVTKSCTNRPSCCFCLTLQCGGWMLNHALQ